MWKNNKKGKGISNGNSDEWLLPLLRRQGDAALTGI